jgi:DNA-binding transcriptional regulator YiaG
MTLLERFQKLTWSKKIKLLRESFELNQQEFADKVGTTQKNVALWEKGKTNPRGMSRKAICRALETTEEEIFGKVS